MIYFVLWKDGQGYSYQHQYEKLEDLKKFLENELQYHPDTEYNIIYGKQMKINIREEEKEIIVKKNVKKVEII